MKKVLLLGLCLTVGACQSSAQASEGVLEVLKPYGVLAVQGAAVTVGAGVVFLGSMAVFAGSVAGCRYWSKPSEELAYARDYLKNGKYRYSCRENSLEIAVRDFVVTQAVADVSIAVDLLLAYKDVKSEKFGAIMVYDKLKAMEDQFNINEKDLMRMLSRLWLNSTIKKFSDCLDQIKVKRDFVRALSAAIEQSDLYKEQLAQKRAQENCHGCGN